MRVVLDTNVIISAYLSPTGTPAKILAYWEKNLFEVVVSEAILDEYARVFQYPRLRTIHSKSVREIATTIKQLRRLAVVVNPSERIRASSDADDNKFIECAVAGEADYIITGDPHLLDLAEYRGILIVSPAAFNAFLEQQSRRAA